jgi:hypothetical protein
MQIVRTYSAGVFAVSGIDNRSKNGKRGTLRNARRLWYWAGAASLSELAQRGTSNPSGCKFPIAVDGIEVSEIIEVLPVSEQAEKSINSVPVWTA